MPAAACCPSCFQVVNHLYICFPSCFPQHFPEAKKFIFRIKKQGLTLQKSTKLRVWARPGVDARKLDNEEADIDVCQCLAPPPPCPATSLPPLTQQKVNKLSCEQSIYSSTQYNRVTSLTVSNKKKTARFIISSCHKPKIRIIPAFA